MSPLARFQTCQTITDVRAKSRYVAGEDRDIHILVLTRNSGESVERPSADHPPGTGESDVFEPDSQLWIRAHSRAPWTIDMPLTPDRDGQWINKRIPDHVAPVDEVTWLADDGIRYLRPEIVLLFKARLQRLKDERDLACAWPLLTAEQQAWLRWAIRRTDEDHPWLERLI